MMKSLRSNPPPKGAAMDTLIGRQTEILGEVRFSGGLHVDGRIKGNIVAIDASASLSVAESGVVEGDVRVPDIRLNGTVIGDVVATARLTLAVKARVTGNVHYKVLQMEPGALINGQLIHESEAAALPRPHALDDGRNDSNVIEITESRRPGVA